MTAILSEGIDIALLLSMMKVFKLHLASHRTLIITYFNTLPMLNRFGITIKCLITKEKADMKSLIAEVGEALEEKTQEFFKTYLK